MVLTLEEAFRAFERKRLERAHFIVNSSRMIGRVAQLQHPILTRIWNYWFKRISSKAIEKQMENFSM